jgi:hypothetical protein
LRFSFSSPMSRSVTVEVFKPASTPSPLLMTSRHGPSRKRRFQQHVYCSCLYVAMGTCLPSHCLDTVLHATVSTYCPSLHSLGNEVAWLNFHPQNNLFFFPQACSDTQLNSDGCLCLLTSLRNLNVTVKVNVMKACSEMFPLSGFTIDVSNHYQSYT